MLRLAAVVTCFACLTIAATARAGVVDNVEAANRLAMENYDLEDFESARDSLTASLATLDKAGLGASATAAATHVLLGVVYGIGIGDEAAAVEQFKAALAIDPTTTVGERYASDATSALLERGRAALAPPPPPKPDCAQLQGIAHAIVGSTEAGTAIDIVAQVGGALRTSSLVLAYRPDGAASFVETPMTASGECDVSARIPAEAVTGATLRYFIVAKSKDGRLLASKGRPTAPFLMAVTAPVIPGDRAGGGEAAGEGGEALENEVPDEIRAPKPANGRTGCASCATSGNGDTAWPLALVGIAFAIRRRRS